MLLLAAGLLAACMSVSTYAQQKETKINERYFIDVHDVQPGKVNFEQVVAAHQKGFTNAR